jgi:hypothetical protein
MKHDDSYASGSRRVQVFSALLLVMMLGMSLPAAAQGGGGDVDSWFENPGQGQSTETIKIIFRLIIKIVVPLVGLGGMVVGPVLIMGGRFGMGVGAFVAGIAVLSAPKLAGKILGVDFEQYTMVTTQALAALKQVVGFIA